MTRRLFYVALGATVGVLVVRKLTETANRLTPGGVLGELTAAVREFTTEVRLGMAEREEELRATLYGEEVTP